MPTSRIRELRAAYRMTYTEYMVCFRKLGVEHTDTPPPQELLEKEAISFAELERARSALVNAIKNHSAAAPQAR